VAATRLDDLDKKLLAAVAAGVARGQQPAVLDLGCGSGGLAVQLAAVGAVVTAVDIVDYQAEIAARNATVPTGVTPVEFIRAAASDFVAKDTSIYHSVILQRVLHYLPYLEALTLLARLRNRTERLYVSVTGVESDIGQQHPLAHAPLFERYARLPTQAQATFSLSAPTCVYTATEFKDVLTETGWKIEDTWTSAFGNHKAIVVGEGSQTAHF
jgi:SAM-dependent methyltransferase